MYNSWVLRWKYKRIYLQLLNFIFWKDKNFEMTRFLCHTDSHCCFRLTNFPTFIRNLFILIRSHFERSTSSLLYSFVAKYKSSLRISLATLKSCRKLWLVARQSRALFEKLYARHVYDFSFNPTLKSQPAPTIRILV